MGRQAQMIATSTSTTDQTQGSTSDPSNMSKFIAEVVGDGEIGDVQLTSESEIEYIFGTR